MKCKGKLAEDDIWLNVEKIHSQFYEFLFEFTLICSVNPYCGSVSELDSGLSTKIVEEQLLEVLPLLGLNSREG